MTMLKRLITANLKEIVRDKMYLFWFLVFPLVFVGIFGLLFSNMGDQAGSGAPGNMNYDIGVASEGETPLPDSVKNQFRDIMTMAKIFSYHAEGKTAEIDAFKKGDRHAVLLMPPDFIDKIQNKEPLSIDLYYDFSHMEVLFAAGELVNALEKNIRGEVKLIQYNLTSSTDIGKKKNGQMAVTQMDFLLPGILALTLMQLGLFGSTRILALKAQRILRALGTTPMPRTMFLASEIIVRLLLSLIQGGIIVVVGHLAFDLTISGSWFAVIGWITLGTSSFIALGYLFTTFVKTAEAGNAISQVIQFPMMFLSGIFIPVEIMPGFLQPLVKFIPLTYLADALRHSMTGLPSQMGTLVNFLVLTGVLVVCMIIAGARFKWE